MNWLKQQVANVAGTAEPVHGPSAIRSVAVQAEKTPYTELRKEDLAWTEMDSTNVETQTFYMTADNGHVGLVQVIYNNVAGLRTTTQFNTKIFYPDRKKPHLWSSDPLENYHLDEPKLCFYADNCALELEYGGGSSGDGKSGGVDAYTVKSARNEASLVNLRFVRKAPGFQVGQDGTSYFGTDPQQPWGSIRHRFWPRCEVRGSIVTKDGEVNFDGKGVFIHCLQGMKPHHAAAKWTFVNFQGPKYSAVMMEFTTPPSYGSTVVNVGAIATDEAIVLAGASNSVVHESVRADDPDWPEPKDVRFTWSGKMRSAAGEPTTVTAELAGSLGTRLDKVDVLAEVPNFVKAIVGGVVGTRPFIYQHIPRPQLTLKVKIGDKEESEVGELFHESTFISE